MGKLNHFLKSKMIVPGDLANYKEIKQLKDVNNHIKHSGESTEKIQYILEFSKKDSFHLENLKVFYTRIREAPTIFINSLKGSTN
jgi:hypothetical protein